MPYLSLAKPYLTNEPQENQEVANNSDILVLLVRYIYSIYTILLVYLVLGSGS